MSKVGKFLIAKPSINSGFFKQAVIYIYEDSPNGTAGVAIHLETKMTFSQIVSQFGMVAETQDQTIYKGGPVNENSLLLLHSDDFQSTNTLHTGTGLDISSDQIMIQKLASSAWPRYYRLVAGVCVWAPGQLDFEIRKNNWLISDLPNDLVFSYDGETLWTQCIDVVSKQVFDRYI